MTFALKRFAMLSMYGGITTGNSKKVSGYLCEALLTLSLIPAASESIKHVGNLAIVLVLVDRTQVSQNQVGDAQCLRPGAGHLDIGEIRLLARWVAEWSRTWVQRWQLLGKVHEDWRGLFLERARGAAPEQIATLISHDHGMRIASCYLNGFVPIHASLLQVDLSRAQL